MAQETPMGATLEKKDVYVHFNRQGSVIATSDAGGSVEGKYEYSPYGVSGEGRIGFPF